MARPTRSIYPTLLLRSFLRTRPAKNARCLKVPSQLSTSCLDSISKPIVCDILDTFALLDVLISSLGAYSLSWAFMGSSPCPGYGNATTLISYHSFYPAPRKPVAAILTVTYLKPSLAYPTERVEDISGGLSLALLPISSPRGSIEPAAASALVTVPVPCELLPLRI